MLINKNIKKIKNYETAIQLQRKINTLFLTSYYWIVFKIGVECVSKCLSIFNNSMQGVLKKI